MKLQNTTTDLWAIDSSERQFNTEMENTSVGLKKGLEERLEKGREEKLKELISRKIQRGKSAELIADELEEDLSVILPLYHQLISSSS